LQLPLDLDHDDTPDVGFWAEQATCTADFPITACCTPFYAAGLVANVLLAEGNGVWIRPQGFAIGNVTGSNVVWSSPGQRLLLSRFWTSDRYGLSGWTTPLGMWGAGFLGVRFQGSDGWHYGWIHVRLPAENESTPVITDWAYETRPDAAICTGARPIVAPLAAPQIVRPGQLRLRWLSDIGTAYQVQSKESANAPWWSNLEFTVIAIATNSLVDIPMTGIARFFRVVEAD